MEFKDILKEMSDSFKDLNKNIAKFKQEQLAQVQECRNSVEQCQNQLDSMLDKDTQGQLIRDSKRLILSAPEIIIGNVDANGKTIAGGTVTILGSTIENKATNTLLNQAPRIENDAVYPSKNGEFSAMDDTSIICNRARNIGLFTYENEDSYVANANRLVGTGITIHSETSLNLTAHRSMSTPHLEDDIKQLKATTDAAEKNINGYLADAVTNGIKEMTDMIKNNNQGSGNLDDYRTNYNDYDDYKDVMMNRLEQLTLNVKLYLDAVASYMNDNYRLLALNRYKEAINKEKGKFDKEASGHSINIHSEHIDISNRDGDGKLRNQVNSSINIQTPHLSMSTRDDDSQLVKDSSITLDSENISLATNDIQYKDKKKRDSADMPAKGSVNILTKSLSIASIDQELKGGKVEEKALTAGSSFTLRTETTTAQAYDKEGKVTGKIALNAKAIEVKGVDQKLEKDKPATDDKMAAGTSVVIAAEKIIGGSKSKEEKAKLVQWAAETVGVFAEKTAELQQGEAKAAVTLDGGKLALGGDNTDVFGKTTLNNATEVKDALKAPSAKIDNLEAGSSFKSPNISDGMGAPGAASSAKVSPKLKAEEIKKEQK